MAWVVRPLCALLVVLLALSGGIVDLCTCDATSHGTFCDEAPAAASCHVVSAPAPSCCCEEPAPVEVRSSGCGCPVLVLEQPPAEPASISAGRLHVDLTAHASPIALVAWVAPAGDDPGTEPWPWAPRPSSGLRRHLELHVLRL